MAMPDRLPPLFCDIWHMVATYHCLLHRCVLIDNTKEQLFKSINLVIKFIKQVDDVERHKLHITHKILRKQILRDRALGADDRRIV